MNKPPRTVMEQVRNKIFALADVANWNDLTDADKNALYTTWTNDPEIGGVLSAYVGVGGVKTYLKDGVIKVYARQSRSDHKMPLIKLGLSSSLEITKTYTKPHGIMLADGKIICWGRSRQWKLVLMALHERSFADQDSMPFGAVLLDSSDGFGDQNARKVVENAATKLGVRKLAWI